MGRNPTIIHREEIVMVELNGSGEYLPNFIKMVNPLYEPGLCPTTINSATTDGTNTNTEDINTDSPTDSALADA